MALTKEDLQAIRDLVREEVKGETAPINRRLDGLEFRLDGLEESQRVICESQSKLEESQRVICESQSKLEESQRVIYESQLKVEHEWLPQIKAAIDENSGGLEKGIENDRRISTLERVVEDHGVRIFKLEEAI